VTSTRGSLIIFINPKPGFRRAQCVVRSWDRWPDLASSRRVRPPDYIPIIWDSA
ncbi:uncharacterized protein METZ01_LOCUS370449, partial [marine metagenome]